jgi:hypothetical protein
MSPVTATMLPFLMCGATVTDLRFIFRSFILSCSFDRYENVRSLASIMRCSFRDATNEGATA